VSTPPRPGRLSATWLKALAHPVRVEVLQSMNAGCSTAKEIADDIGEPVGTISHHLKTLLELECIEIAETRQKRGAMEYVYRPLSRGFEFSNGEWAEVPPAARAGINAAIIREMMDTAIQSLRDGKLEERTDYNLSNVALRLDEEGWREIDERLIELVSFALGLQQRAADLPPEDVVESMLMLMHLPR
jgi:DNA-binding transcriptional ArsR family regulator